MKNKPEIDKASTAPTVKALNVKNQAIKQGFNMSDSTVVTTNRAIAMPDLTIVDGQITTTSNQIAEHFGKRHDVVLRAVRNLECSENFRLHNFAESSYTNEQGKKMPCYRITRDGFSFLAMGFTGKEAAQWKEAYITTFNKMEAELRGKTVEANPAIDYTRISSAQAQDLKEIVQAIVDAKVQSYGETWRRLQNKFRVNSYLQLSASCYEEARAYLIAKLPAGYAGDLFEKEPEPQLMDLALVEPAMAAANAVAAQVQKQAFMAMVKSTCLQRGRWTVSFGYRDDGAAPNVREIDDGSFIGTLPQMAKLIQDPGTLLESQDLMDLAKACMNRLATRLEARALAA